MLNPGSEAPAFELASLNGGRRSLASLLADGPIVLVFFKISCPTCELTLPFIDRIARAGGRIVAISQDDAESTRQFNKHLSIAMETLLDAKGYPASNAYGIEYVPTFFDVGADGRIAHSYTAFVKTEIEALGRRFHVEPFRAGETVPAMKPG